MSEIIRKYSPEKTSELRDEFVKKFVKPHVQAIFDKYPRYNSVAFLVAQYWCDEALDAVHYEIFPSVLETPDLEHARKVYQESDYGEVSDEVNAPGLKNPWYEELIEWEEDELAKNWDDNCGAIPLFAAFCEENCHQEMDFLEAYSTYAIFRRDNDNLKVEIVGKIVRPWIDGVSPEWEKYR